MHHPSNTLSDLIFGPSWHREWAEIDIDDPLRKEGFEGAFTNRALTDFLRVGGTMTEWINDHPLCDHAEARARLNTEINRALGLMP